MQHGYYNGHLVTVEPRISMCYKLMGFDIPSFLSAIEMRPQNCSMITMVSVLVINNNQACRVETVKEEKQGWTLNTSVEFSVLMI